MSESISVQTSTQNTYKLQFGNGLSAELGAYIQKFSTGKAFIMVDAFVLQHHRDYFEDTLSSNFTELHIFEVPRGEQAKTFEVYRRAVGFILKKGTKNASFCDRRRCYRRFGRVCGGNCFKGNSPNSHSNNAFGYG